MTFSMYKTQKVYTSLFWWVVGWVGAFLSFGKIILRFHLLWTLGYFPVFDCYR